MAMGWKANESLLGVDTAVHPAVEITGIGGAWYELLPPAVITILAWARCCWLFLGTQLGLSIRATGDNPDMVRASSLNPDVHHLRRPVRLPTR